MCDIMKEADYKVATIDWLINRGYLEHDAVLINELPVDNFSRRADLVVANGKLHAFEIKSDADSLARLQGQIETYLAFFDKVTLVCSPKFTNKAIEMLPNMVEILELEINSQGDASLKVKRRGRIEKVGTASDFLSFVDKRHLVTSLKSKKLACQLSETRSALNAKLSRLPKSHWRNLVLDYLKNKYRPTYQSFLANKHDITEVSDLTYLSPQKLQTEPDQMDITRTRDDVWEINIDGAKVIAESGVDISESMNQFGFVTSKPIKVIPRVLKQAT
ncbi:sce7726 family protein [Vibrio alginolyticus]|nr:sce7726 family protein [Vibrio alginolyticus]EGQ9214565.1 sce7726 family protein [Vibrio alginolyticus]